MAKSASRAGFTLAEITVVLLVVGLVAGGVIVGSQLLYTAKIQKTVSQIQQIKANMIAFKLKYGKYPGDFNRATQFWPVSKFGTIDGNGDGWISSWNDPNGPNYEAYNAFHHLSLAGLVWGTYYPVSSDNLDLNIWPNTCQSCSAVVEFEKSYVSVTSGTHWTSQGANTNWLVLSSRKVPIKDIMFIIAMLSEWGVPGGPEVGILAKDAWAIDTKMDDGRPLTGKVRSNMPLLGNWASDYEGYTQEEIEQEQAAWSTWNCLKLLGDLSRIYNLDNTHKNCVLLMPIEQ